MKCLDVPIRPLDLHKIPPLPWRSRPSRPALASIASRAGSPGNFNLLPQFLVHLQLCNIADYLFAGSGALVSDPSTGAFISLVELRCLKVSIVSRVLASASSNNVTSSFKRITLDLASSNSVASSFFSMLNFKSLFSNASFCFSFASFSRVTTNLNDVISSAIGLASLQLLQNRNEIPNRAINCINVIPNSVLANLFMTTSPKKPRKLLAPTVIKHSSNTAHA